MPDGRSLRLRLVWYLLAMLAVVTTASGIVVYLDTRQEADEAFDSALLQTARMLDILISPAGIDTYGDQWRRALQDDPGGQKFRRHLFFAVFDADGELLLQSDKAPGIDHESVVTGFFDISRDRKKWFAYGLESSDDGLTIIVGQNSKDREEITEHVGGGLVLPLILLLPPMLWLLWKLIGVALRPLEAVAAQVRRQDIRYLRPIDVAGVPLEIDPLVTALNRMIADLDAAYARERRFVSDASHELRNPLASLLINVDNALEESRGRATTDSLQSMKTSIMRLSHLVSQLLALGHFENPLSGRTLQSVDLGRVCRRVTDSFAPQARDAGVEIQLQLESGNCEIRGDESLFASLVSNLVDNAVKYSGRGAQIRVGCAADAFGLLLTVEDSGAGLSAAQRQQACKRFYRAADGNTVGAGLGLSIVETIADLHGAGVELDESPLGGLRVRIRFDKA